MNFPIYFPEWLLLWNARGEMAADQEVSRGHSFFHLEAGVLGENHMTKFLILDYRFEVDFETISFGNKIFGSSGREALNVLKDKELNKLQISSFDSQRCVCFRIYQRNKGFPNNPAKPNFQLRVSLSIDDQIYLEQKWSKLRSLIIKTITKDRYFVSNIYQLRCYNFMIKLQTVPMSLFSQIHCEKVSRTSNFSLFPPIWKWWCHFKYHSAPDIVHSVEASQLSGYGVLGHRNRWPWVSRFDSRWRVATAG